MREPLVECVPNVSEGRDRASIDRMASAIRAAGDVTLMNVHADPDHHRSVFSFLGGPAAVEAAALALAETALAAVDLRHHRGTHPRVGALDVLPFVPLATTAMTDAVTLARRAGRAIAERHRVPVYYYGEAATRATRRRLPDVRGRGYDALAARLAAGDAPDDGPACLDPRVGATLVGARRILVAFNVWLDTDDLSVAHTIARAVREAGGGLPGVQALGMLLASRGVTQVSMNLLDYERTSIPAAFDRVQEEAARSGVRVQRSELVGVAPRAAFAGRAPASVGLSDLTPDLLLDSYLQTGAR